MTEPHLRNLPVPFLSQRKNTYVFKGKYEGGMEFDSGTDNDNDHFLTDKSAEESIDDNTNNVKVLQVSMASRSCNITCIAMILHYFGIKSETPHTPDKMMENYFAQLGTTFAGLVHKTDTGTAITYKSVMAFEIWTTMKEFVKIMYADRCTLKLYEDPRCTMPC